MGAPKNPPMQRCVQFSIVNNNLSISVDSSTRPEKRYQKKKNALEVLVVRALGSPGLGG